MSWEETVRRRQESAHVARKGEAGLRTGKGKRILPEWVRLGILGTPLGAARRRPGPPPRRLVNRLRPFKRRGKSVANVSRSDSAQKCQLARRHTTAFENLHPSHSSRATTSQSACGRLPVVYRHPWMSPRFWKESHNC